MAFTWYAPIQLLIIATDYDPAVAYGIILIWSGVWVIAWGAILLIKLVIKAVVPPIVREVEATRQHTSAPIPESTVQAGNQSLQTDTTSPRHSDYGQKRTRLLLLMPLVAPWVVLFIYYGGDSDQNRTQPPTAKMQVLPDQSLSLLLDRADQQRAERKLITPKGDNALETYREVLRRSPGNAKALAGLKRIQEQYQQWAQGAEREGDHAKAQRYYERASRVTPNDEGLATDLERVKLSQQSWLPAE